jgi:hypothetical protein
MRVRSSRSAACLLITCLVQVPVVSAQAATPAPTTATKENRVTARAMGSFEVTVVPLTEGVRREAWAPGRMSIDKVFTGDLLGKSQGEMLTAMTEVQGSAGYVAIERFEGSLLGRKGSFLLQHNAIMRRGVPGDWTVLVVPDSGTGELQGLRGSMTIKIAGGKHSYTLEFTLDETP